MITPQDKQEAEREARDKADFDAFMPNMITTVHPIFQPILDDLTSRHRWEQERRKRNALKCCTGTDQELIDAAAVCFSCEQQNRAIREALGWLEIGQPWRAQEALERALP